MTSVSDSWTLDVTILDRTVPQLVNYQTTQVNVPHRLTHIRMQHVLKLTAPRVNTTPALTSFQQPNR